MEGEIKFSATHTPSFDKFETVTLMAFCLQQGGRGSVTLHKEVSVAEAREFAAQIESACVVVERDA